MLDLKNTRIFMTEMRPVASGVVVPDEGVALVYVKDGSQTKVRPSTGASGEVFAGFSLSRNVPPAYIPNVEEGLVPTGATITLARLPIAGQIGILVDGTALNIVAAAPVNASEVQVSADQIIFHASAVGKPYVITYQYLPTVDEARTFVGDMPIGGLSSTAMAQIGLITRGDVSTSFYDASQDWSSVINPTLGPDGMLTVGGTGTVLNGVTVLETPNSNNVMLNLRVEI